MTNDTTNLLQFPRINLGNACSPEILELLAGITTLLRTADRLAQLAKEVDLEEEKKLIFVNKIKDIVAVASSLYLVMLSDSEKERNIRARIEIIINTLDEI